MSAFLFLIGLLVLAYVGSLFAGNRTLRGFGLVSGAEYVLLGLAVGPNLLGWLDHTVLESFTPVAHVLVGWMGLMAGMEFAFEGRRTVRIPSLVGANVAALLTTVWVGFMAFILLTRRLGWAVGDATVAAAGMGLVSCETTRHAARWVVQRYGAEGPATQAVLEFTDSDELVPILGTAVLACVRPAPQLQWALPLWGWLSLGLGLGLVMGVLASMLLGREFRLLESWGVLLGASMLGTGVSVRLGLSPLAVMFCMGIVIARLSRHGIEVRAMAAQTEHAALLPVLVMAGASVRLDVLPHVGWIAVVVIVARLTGTAAEGALMRLVTPSIRTTGPALGLGLMSAGEMTVVLGFGLSLRFHEPVGQAILIAALATTFAGEIVGPPMLLACLRRAGELKPPSSRGLAAILRTPLTAIADRISREPPESKP